jgi:glutamate-1-semialdehyde 2,1-aminomutase
MTVNDSDEVVQPRIVAIVQARLGSVRFPRKVLQELGGRPALSLLLHRLGHANRVDEIVLATPDGDGPDEMQQIAREHGVRHVRGSEHDVLDRYHMAAKVSQADVVVRITGDCPLVDPEVVDAAIALLLDEGLDLVSTDPDRFPDGLDVQVCRASVLDRAWREATEASDREHVLTYVTRDASVSRSCLPSPYAMGHVRITLDEPEDLRVLRAIADYLDVGDTAASGIAQLRDLLEQRPELLDANRHLTGISGATMGTGQKLWRHAQRRIPGGTMLLSKNPDRVLPERWPAYFSRARGCDVWDLDGHRYTDVSFMGVGTNILGYGHPKVDEAVRDAVARGNLTTLNAREEVELADLLCELHPWAEMVRFTRSGGEACAVAVRIARSASGKDSVAICGYHGWHDWYLAANLSAAGALDGHLLPGLEPLGVPRALTGTVHPFRYGDLETLEQILKDHAIGTIITEVERSVPAPPGYLDALRTIADRHGAVLVFDECTSGFRRVLGGLHLHHGVEPDICILGKTLGNGYAINAVIGRENVMEVARRSFISSTFWTERIGPTAALATLRVMQEEDGPQRVHDIGLEVRRRWEAVAASSGVPVQPNGAVPAISSFDLTGVETDVLRTFIAQEMLEHGMLASNVFYASIAHNQAVLEQYEERLASVLQRVASLGADEALKDALEVPTATARFGRLA